MSSDPAMTGAIPANVRNRYLAAFEFANGRERPESLPSDLQIGLSNSCNFHCVYCPDHRPGNTLPRTRLEGEVRDGLLALVPRISTLAFHGISEFFLDRDFFEIVRRCAEAGADLSLNTNGSIASERHLAVLASYPGHVEINFSLDAASAATFKHVRGADFDPVLANVRSYVERFAGRRDRSWISVSFVIVRSNVAEVARFVELAKELRVDKAKFYRLHEYAGLAWSVATQAGGTFDYREECTAAFKPEYDRAVADAVRVASALGLKIEVPAPYDEPAGAPS